MTTDNQSKAELPSAEMIEAAKDAAALRPSAS